MTTRDRILDAAEQVMRNDGLARTTTRKVAAAAGFSEATLYKHFDSKEELFLAVLSERLPRFVDVDRTVGTDGAPRPFREHLEAVAAGGIAFYESTWPMAGSIFADPDLLARHAVFLRERDTGPYRPIAVLAADLAHQQRAEAIHPDTDSAAAAALLLGACFQTAFLRRFNGDGPMPADQREAWARDLVASLWTGLDPGGSSGQHGPGSE